MYRAVLKFCLLYRFLPRLFLIFLCFSCTYHYEVSEKFDFLELTYEKELAKLYINYSKSEASQYDWKNSYYFKNKALKILSGQDVYPENLDNSRWHHLLKNDKEILGQARSHLMELLDNKDFDVRSLYPLYVAQVQFFFDCWVEQQNENWQIEDIISCKEGFYHLLDKIYDLLYDKKSPKKIINKSEVTLEAKKNYRLEFDLTRKSLTEEKLSLVKHIVDDFKRDSFKKKIYILVYELSKEKAKNNKIKEKATDIENEMLSLGIKSKSIDKLFFTSLEGYQGENNSQFLENFLEIVIE